MPGIIGLGQNRRRQGVAVFDELAQEETQRNHVNRQIKDAEKASKQSTIATSTGAVAAGLSSALAPAAAGAVTTGAGVGAAAGAATAGAATAGAAGAGAAGGAGFLAAMGPVGWIGLAGLAAGLLM